MGEAGKGSRETGDSPAVVAVRSGRVAVGDIEMAYDEAGRGSRPLVLVHGFTGHRADFAEHLPALGQLGRTLAPDLRGHGETGRTGREEDYRFDRLVEDLEGFLDAVGAGRIDLLGHSMGGMVALRLALARPERVASLILMDTAPGPLRDLPLETFRLAWRVARESGMEVLQGMVRARAAEDPTRTGADRRLEAERGPEWYWERHRRRFLAMDPVAYAELGRELVEQQSLVPRLSEIRCASLVLVGEEDRSFLEPAEVMAAALPGARLVVIPGAGHQPQFEAPGPWLEAIRDHLRRVRGRKQDATGAAR